MKSDKAVLFPHPLSATKSMMVSRDSVKIKALEHSVQPGVLEQAMFLGSFREGRLR
jgi:hypothetical protein